MSTGLILEIMAFNCCCCDSDSCGCFNSCDGDGDDDGSGCCGADCFRCCCCCCSCCICCGEKTGGMYGGRELADPLKAIESLAKASPGPPPTCRRNELGPADRARGGGGARGGGNRCCCSTKTAGIITRFISSRTRFWWCMTFERSFGGMHSPMELRLLRISSSI